MLLYVQQQLKANDGTSNVGSWMPLSELLTPPATFRTQEWNFQLIRKHKQMKTRLECSLTSCRTGMQFKVMQDHSRGAVTTSIPIIQGHCRRPIRCSKTLYPISSDPIQGILHLWLRSGQHSCFAPLVVCTRKTENSNIWILCGPTLNLLKWWQMSPLL